MKIPSLSHLAPIKIVPCQVNSSRRRFAPRRANKPVQAELGPDQIEPLTFCAAALGILQWPEERMRQKKAKDARAAIKRAAPSRSAYVAQDETIVDDVELPAAAAGSMPSKLRRCRRILTFADGEQWTYVHVAEPPLSQAPHAHRDHDAQLRRATREMAGWVALLREPKAKPLPQCSTRVTFDHVEVAPISCHLPDLAQTCAAMGLPPAPTRLAPITVLRCELSCSPTAGLRERAVLTSDWLPYLAKPIDLKLYELTREQLAARLRRQGVAARAPSAISELTQGARRSLKARGEVGASGGPGGLQLT